MPNRTASAKYLPPIVGKNPAGRPGANAGPDEVDCMMTRMPRIVFGKVRSRLYTRKSRARRAPSPPGRGYCRTRREPDAIPNSFSQNGVDRFERENEPATGVGRSPASRTQD